MSSGAVAPQAKTAAPVKEVTTASFRADVLTASHAPAGAGRLLGAVVRAVQAARAGAGEGGRRLGRQGRARQDEHRRASADRRPARHPVDSGRHRLRQGPAGRRIRRRAAGEPDPRLHRAARRAARGRVGRAARRGRGSGRQGRRGRARRRSTPRSWPRTPATPRRSAVSPSCMSRPGSSTRRRRCWRRRPRPRPARSRIRRSPPPGRRCAWPSRPRTSASSRRSSRRSPPIPTIIRRASISPSRCRPRATGTGAADQLLEIIRRDRKWNDEAARKQLLQFFEAWGLMDPAIGRGAAQTVGDLVLKRRAADGQPRRRARNE